MKSRGNMKKSILLLLLIFTLNIFSQKEANFWYFGENAGLDFNTSPPTALTDGKLNTLEGCSSFSDSNGDLLFYSDGTTVYNKNHDIMAYTDGSLGNNLLGDPSATQSGMIIPKPQSTSIYYLFTVTDNNSSDGFNLYTVDMSKDGGNGELIDEDGDGVFFVQLQGAASWSEKISAVKGSDCNTYWVVTVNNNVFYSYLVDLDGVRTTPVTSTVSNNSNTRGYLKLSPDGTKLAIANQSSNNSRNSAILYDFDNETGRINNKETFIINGTSSGQAYGVEFSVDSKKLYISTVSRFRDFGDPPVDYKLFQFDLTATDIPDSSVLIHEQIGSSPEYPEGGFRGALQLGPDGRIYATIPTTYADPSGFALFLDVIENPTADAVDIIFTKNAINLAGKKATQGLPPFISSLLLPIEITDNMTGEIINNQDLKSCVGDDRTLEPEDVQGDNKTYEWFFDDGTSTSLIAQTLKLNLLDLQESNSGIYTLTLKLTDDCGNTRQYDGSFNLSVYKAAIATKPADIPPFCDTDATVANDFDLTIQDNSILGGLDPTIFSVLYYDTLTKANDNLPNTALPNPYQVNTTGSQKIYARVQNKNAPEACFDITDFIILVTGLPVPETPLDYPFCDNTSVGSDTDGFVNDFILKTKDLEILGTLDINQYNVSYHTSANGAQTNASLDVIDKTIKYTNTTANTQPIYVRVESVNNTACFDASKSFNIIVNALPVVANFVKLLQCDDDLDRVSTINLTESEISVSTNYLNETFTYFETEADAILGTPQVIDKLRYPVNRTATAWVRTISPENCFRISQINLEVEAAADVNYYKNFPSVCDDFLENDGTDGPLNSETDGITNFDFSAANTEILAFFPPDLQPDLEISFYETKEDRTAVINAIMDISNYRNIGYPSNVIKQTIYFKIINKNNNNCNGSGELYLKTDPVPTANQAKDIPLCDNLDDGDFVNGIVQTFDLDSQTSVILGTQNNANYTVTYHLSKIDANSGNDPQASLFTNTIRDLQTIYVRVTNNNTGCFTDRTSFDLIVNPLPIANFVKDLEICDDNTDGSAQNGFSQEFDLELQTAGILGSQDPTQFSVTYHASLDDAQAGIFPLGSPFTNSVPFSQIIYARVYNSLTGCANGISNFNAVVNPEPTTENASNLSFCDDDLDGSDTNGFLQNIDLDSQITEILGTLQDPDDFTVTFHETQVDATDGAGALSSPYTNTTADQQTIFVRVVNDDTLCVNDDFTFDVIVNTLPDFEVTSPQILCLNDAPENISVENPLDIYSYVWRDVNGNTIGDDKDNLDVYTGGNYTVTATTTNGTNCSRTKTITVSESDSAILLNSFVTIVDEGNNIGSENNSSISIDILNNNLGPGDYQFALINDDTNTSTSFQDEPLFENLEGGFYTIVVRDLNGCIPDTKLQVSVLQFPKFFTPNGDGSNDTWLLKGVNKAFYPNSSINVFNRYGKLVAQLPIDGPGWNGTYNSKKLPSDDYWYNVTLIPADLSKPAIKKTGNFSLLRK